MADRLYCAKGHSWTPTFPIEVWPPDFRSACPTCGDSPIGPSDVTATTARLLVVLDVILLVAGLVFAFIDENTIPVAIILFVIAGVIPLVGVGIWVGRQRTKEMAGIAEAMGFSFMANLVQSGLRAIAPFQLFGLGHSQKAYNAMQGRVGDCDVIFFEYQYTIGSGKSAHTHQLSAVILPDGAPGVPDFRLAPKTFFDKLAGFFTQNNIEIEDAADFTKRYKLGGPNAGALRELFHPDLVDYLCRDSLWFIEAMDGQLLIYRGARLAPDKCPGLVADALELRDLLRDGSRQRR